MKKILNLLGIRTWTYYSIYLPNLHSYVDCRESNDGLFQTQSRITLRFSTDAPAKIYGYDKDAYIVYKNEIEKHLTWLAWHKEHGKTWEEFNSQTQ